MREILTKKKLKSGSCKARYIFADFFYLFLFDFYLGSLTFSGIVYCNEYFEVTKSIYIFRSFEFPSLVFDLISFVSRIKN